MRDALGVIEARAIYDGDEHEANVRIAQRDWLIYVDLADAERRVIEVSPGGWRVIGSAHAPVRFVQPRGMRALPAPEPGGSLDELRSLLNVGDDSQWALIVGWLIASINPDGPYPILALNGEQGSAKSTTARMLRALLDPNDAPLRAEPREARDLMIAANNARVIALDNISRVQPWLSDGLCRLATGGGFTTRELYSDADETIFDAQRPIVLNGISDYVDRSDLLDRTIGLTLPTIPEGQHRTERDLWREFERLQPRILGALFAAAACALSRRDEVRLDSTPRMADAAAWIVAAEPALPIGEGEFLKAYRADRASAREQAIEASPVGPAIMALARRCHPDGWSGTMTDLLAEIEDGDITDARTRRRRDWPGSARGLGAALRRIAPDLREAGVEVRLPSRTRRMVAVEWTDPSGPDGHDDPDGPGGDHARAPSDSGGENGPARRAQRARRAPNPPESLESAIPADSAPDNARADARVGRRNARIGRPDARSNARSKNGPDDPVSPESAHCARRARCAGDFSGSGPASAHARTAEAERLGLDDPEPADRADPPDNGSSAGERVGSDWTGDPDHAIESRARRAMRDAHSEALAAGKGPRDAELTAQRAFRLIYRHAGRTPPEPPAIGDVLDAEPVEDDA